MVLLITLLGIYCVTCKESARRNLQRKHTSTRKTRDILVTTELQTGNGVCHKICEDNIVDNLFKLPILTSKWNMLVEECDYKITERRSKIFLHQILMLYIKMRSFSYATDVVQKYKLNQKAIQKKSTTERNSKSSTALK